VNLSSVDIQSFLVLDETPAAGIFINVIEIKRDGWISRMRLGVEDLLTYFVGQEPEASGQGKSSVSCFRDLVI
jgi:hypothetical protein